MLDQIAQGFQYYGIYQEQDLIGYFSYQVKDGQMFLSKYYLIKEQRGLGYGRKTNEFIIQIAKQLGLSSINLTVNKLNEGSIAAYEKMGFRRRGELVMDIGGGFVMDDYRYEYPLN
jgi:RimJ/RimL family protein N-acetyltransferase